MKQLIQAGNFGIVEISRGNVASYSIGNKGWSNFASMSLNMPDSWNTDRCSLGAYTIIPYGRTNDFPNELRDLLDRFYSGEGILGKIAGLQWGEGPRLYRETYSPDGDIIRTWVRDDSISRWLDSFNYEEYLHKSLTDLVHTQGFFFKAFLNRGARLGSPMIAKLEHVSVNKCRLEAPYDNEDYPRHIIVGDFPVPRTDKIAAYPVFDFTDPFRHRVAMGYQNIYSFGKDFYSTPRYFGALSWIELAASIAPLLKSYNINSSAISYHIESPQEYWNAAEDLIRADCSKKGIPYSNKMLQEFKEEAFKQFSAAMAGEENPGKFIHTQQFFNPEANNFQGWKITPIDKKIKEYIDAQIAIADKADSAATSGFGLHPSLSNIMIDGKLASGSELLYAMKSYIVSETAIPELILFKPVNTALRLNFGTDLKLGFYRKIVMKESEVSPSNRIGNNV